MQSLYKCVFIFFSILLYVDFIYMYKNCHEPSTCGNQVYDVHCSEFTNQCVKTIYNDSTIDLYYWQNSIFFSNVYNAQLLYQIKIQPFLNCKTRNEVKLNITFSNISWNSLYLHYTQENNENSSRYRIFCVGNSSAVSSIHEYLFINSLEPNKTFFLEIRANENYYTEVRKFKFFVPFGYHINENYNIDKRKIFLYLDVTDVNNKIILYINILPFTSCLIEVYKENGDAEGEKLKSEYYGSNNSIVEEIEYIYNVNKFDSGVYYFVVTPFDERCINGTCLPNYSPKVYIDSSIVIVICQSVIIIVLLTIVLICICLCRYLIKKGSHVPKSANVLLISRAVHQNHIVIIEEFINCLKMLDIDIVDSSLIKCIDPTEWCNNVFKNADIIVIIASPNIKNSESEVHRNIDNIFINLITIELSKPILTKKFCLVKFPYCVGNNVHTQAKNFQQFTMISDFNKFITFLNNEKYIYGCNVTSLICCNMFSKIHIDKQKLIKLKMLIREANISFQLELYDTENSVSNNITNDDTEENIDLACSSFLKNTQTFLSEYNEKSENLKISSVQESGFDINSLNLTGLPEPETQKPKEINKNNFEINIRNLVL